MASVDLKIKTPVSNPALIVSDTLLFGALSPTDLEPSTIRWDTLVAALNTTHVAKSTAATLNAIPVFSNTTGAAIKNTGVTIDATNNIATTGHVSGAQATMNKIFLNQAGIVSNIRVVVPPIAANTNSLSVKLIGGVTRWVSVDGTGNELPLDIMIGASSIADGVLGFVPKPVIGDEIKVLRGNGTWSAALSVISEQTFAASDTWTKPAGAVLVEVEVCGAGAGGGAGTFGDNSVHRGGGGGGSAGSSSKRILPADDVPASVVVTIGAPGAGGTTGGGANGGTSSFGTLLIAAGGMGGPIGAAADPGAATPGTSFSPSRVNNTPGTGPAGTGGIGRASGSGGNGIRGSIPEYLGGPGGGGGGSGKSTSPAVFAGGTGGAGHSSDGTGLFQLAGLTQSGGAAGGAAGANGSDAVNVQLPNYGHGGGGGGSSLLGAGANGGLGATPGGGGGGGGGGLLAGGVGGAGGGGEVRVCVYG